MYAEHAPHAVPGAVVIVQALPPQRAPGQCVQIFPHDPLGELCHGQLYVALQHLCGPPAFLVRDGAQRYGAGHVRRAPGVVSAAVHQQQSLRLQRHVRLRCGGVVDHGSVGAIGGDGLEAVLQKIRLFRPVPMQQRRGGQLGVRLRP